MAYHYSLCILGVMDRLWFHQMVLFSESTASLSCPSLPSPPGEEETSIDAPPSSEKQVSSRSISLPLQDDSNKEEGSQEGPKKMNLLGNRIRLHSSSPSPNRHRKSRKLATARRLQKSMSYRTLGELELEEVKGFMDLGFTFKKENMSPRMMSVVPGLQRLSMHQNERNAKLIDAPKAVEDDVEKTEDREDISIMRPYLSEAWLIKRPDSQVLNLKIPRLPSAADMKNHLRFWAKTVASEIHQE